MTRERVVRRTIGAFAVTLSQTLGACEVTNPGPVQDEFLREASSHAALVKGAGFRLATALNNLAYDGALPSREIFPTGQTGAAGHPVLNQAGHWPDGDANQWDNLQQARFVAEHALRILVDEGALPAEEQDRSPLVAEAHLWAAFAYRVFGEHYCYVVFDGGGVEPSVGAFERAEAHFTRAMEVASNAGDDDMALAAQAGRAQVRMWMGDWDGAVSDASAIPDEYEFGLDMDGDPAGARNLIWFASTNLPYRTLTAWGSSIRDYYEETGDERTASGQLEGFPWSTGALSGFGQVPFLQQKKYNEGTEDVRLASGAEMRLLEAEALLISGDWAGAMQLINAVRTRNMSDMTGEPLSPWVAANADEAWTFLKRERGVELWLEGRRWGDQRRWQEQGAPGALDWPNYESRSDIFADNERSRCFGVPDSERDANLNVPQELPTDGLWGLPF